MNILFLTLADFNTLSYHDINTDLLREFVNRDHKVYIISPTEKRQGQCTHIIAEGNNTVIFKQKIGNIQKTKFVEKGISTIHIPHILIRGIKKEFSKVRFDLVVYNTPPITLCKVVEYVKKRDHAQTYLLLKDIFPQNAVDIGIIRNSGIGKIIYHYFKIKEEHLYHISDHIGCMSAANMKYLRERNPGIPEYKLDVCPNSMEIRDMSVDIETRKALREKYDIPQDKVVFVFGGNLGKPQGIGFMLKCIHSQRKNQKVFFLVIGDGTEYGKIKNYQERFGQSNLKLLKRLPKEDYDRMVGACDVGLLFLDHRFTIPNYPSRILSYMSAKLPILACTDKNTDIREDLIEGRFGWWCESTDVKQFIRLVNEAVKSNRTQMGENAYKYLRDHFDCRYAADIVLNSIETSRLEEAADKNDVGFGKIWRRYSAD